MLTQIDIQTLQYELTQTFICDDPEIVMDWTRITSIVEAYKHFFTFTYTWIENIYIWYTINIVFYG